MSLHLDRGAVDLAVYDEDLRQVLDELFMEMGAECDLAPEVQGRVHLVMHNATYQQALEALLEPEYTYHVGPHDRVYIYKKGTTWKPGWEEPAA